MERLTDKETKTLNYSEENNITLSNSRIEAGKRTSYFYGKPIEKLAEFEDFMEEQGFESLEQLKDFMQDTKNAMLDVLKVADRWQKLKDYLEYCKDDAPFAFNKMEELEKEIK